MSRRQDHHLQHHNNVLGIRTNDLLNDIKTNTSSVNVNTDTLEALQTTANAHHAVNETKLTNIQTITDTKLSAIQNFLDKDHAQFHLKHHTTSNLVGNTAVDGSGAHNHAHVDGSGVLRVSQVSSQNVQPSNTANADHASHSMSLAVGLRGRTNITDETSGKFLLCDANGHLQADIANQPNFKLEDLSSSLNAQHASGTSRSMAVGIKGATDISDVVNTSTFLKCDSDGFLRVSSEPRVEGATTRVNNIILENSLGTGSNTSATVDLGVAHKMKVVKFYINSSTGGFNLHVRVSADGTNYVYVSAITFQTISLSGGGSVHIATATVENPPRYIQLYNNDTASTYTISELVVVKST